MALVREISQLPVGGDAVSAGISKSPSATVFFTMSLTLSHTRFVVLWNST